VKQKLLFQVIYEDDRLIAVDKASGLSVGGDRWDDFRERLDKSLAAFLAERTGAPTGSVRLFTVHRIDRDASGIVVFAKDADTHRALSRAFEERLVEKRYIAVVHGRPGWEETLCDLPLVPDGNKQHLTIIDKYRGKKSLTHFRLLGGVGNYSVLEARPETGRTHQIRVHLASLGHPIVCDPLYGSDKPVMLSSFKPGWRGDPLDERPLLRRLALHAAELALPPPAELPAELPAAEALRIRASLHRDMAALIKQMEKQAGGFKAFD
jgi:RluA family pseudouridine synthase